MTLTSAEMRTIDYLADSLFTVALGNARRRATHWPPASYLKDSKLIKHYHQFRLVAIFFLLLK